MIGFIILHYQTIEDTIKCIESIKRNILNNYQIVVVDNASPNSTGEILDKKYYNDDRIKVVLKKENLGFAKGNNAGFKYLKENFNCDFIVMMNNDTEILQENFYNIIEEEYFDSQFDILGPKIILADNTINPIVTKMRTAKDIRNEIIKLRLKLLLNYVHLDRIVDIKKIFNKRTSNNLPNERHENIVLHGCCLIFSRKYIEMFDGIDDRTFLYHEEELLFERARKNNLKIIYSPKLKILHKEYGATKTIAKTKNKTRRFRYKNLILSAKVLYKDLKNEI